MCYRARGVLAVGMVIETGAGIQFIGSRHVIQSEITLQYDPEQYALGYAGWCSCVDRGMLDAFDGGYIRALPRPPTVTLTVECIDLVRIVAQETVPLPQLPSGLYLPSRAYAALPGS